MSHSADNTTGAEGPRLTLRQLQQLCTRVLDEVASEEESHTLNRVLANDPAARQVYLRHVALHSALHASTGKKKQAEAELLRLHIAQAVRDEDSAIDGGPAPAGADSLAEERPALVTAGSGLRISLGTLLALAASVMAIAIGGGLWMSSQPDSVAVAAAKNDADESMAAARVSYLSNAAQMTIGKLTPQQSLAAGDTVSLAEGQVELTYLSGTKLLLIGPADFIVEKEGGALRRGGLVASVTEAGHGFTIETPNGKVVDLGTEFGVAVDDLGVSEVSVFDGKVEAFPGSDAGSKIELTKGHGLQWDQENLVELDADLRRFATSVLEYANLGGKAIEHPLLIDSFSQDNLDANRWKSLGDASSKDGGLRMRGQGVIDERPYLVAAEPIDMSLGAVTVTCDFRFEESPNDNASSLAIFSRGADSRGVALQPWRGMLASGVRCVLDSDPQSGQATLRAGVKLESNREVTEVASTSLPALRRGVPYRVVMRDDGVNVSLTLSERDTPQSAKTVRCRSLFRGAQNHVAFEGGVDGVTLIESVAISQSSSTPAFHSYADLSSILQKGPDRSQIERRLLDSLAPAGVPLLVEDDFDADELDPALWSTLGKVKADSGAVRLGVPNKEGHIDTWKPRPYLLTSMPIDPTAGPVTVLGRVRFADNFLAGYGASFSVMTRAEGQRGSGPGWEHSVLRRGVRANLWPASWDSEHSLELHEKPVPNTTTLLATKQFPVDPRVRSYVFRLVDDGETVAWTIVDPNRPDQATTITSPASDAANPGLIGFESCWGSPVLLDDVRVYQAVSPANQESGDQSDG